MVGFHTSFLLIAYQSPRLAKKTCRIVVPFHLLRPFWTSMSCFKFVVEDGDVLIHRKFIRANFVNF